MAGSHSKFCAQCGAPFTCYPSEAHRVMCCSVACGRLLRAAKPRVAVVERLWRKVDVRSETECWEWQGSTNGRGYGILHVNGQRIGVHRIACELAHGPTPEGMEVRHKCDNRLCCNPSHVEYGTHMQNIQDMVDRGRNTMKLSPALVAEIRTAHRVHGIKQKELAAKYGVSRAAICMAISGVNWSRVQEQ